MWLNDPAVRAAIHAAPIEEAGAPWTICRRAESGGEGGAHLPAAARHLRHARNAS